MALARFFNRTLAATGRALSVSPETLETALANHVVGVVCGVDCTAEGNSRWIAELLVNLLARLYPRLAIEADPAIREHLLGIARSINPRITTEEAQNSTVTVVVGMGESSRPHTLYARADGWVARVLLQPSQHKAGPVNPYSSAATASLAAGEVFRIIFHEHFPKHREPREVNLSLLDFSTLSGENEPLGTVNLGQVALVGVGAVGNGALWALGRHASLTGEMWLVDPQPLEVSNLQRYVLGMDADEGRAKVDLADATLRKTDLQRHLCKESLEGFADRFKGGFSIPTVCVAVDTKDGRRAVQALLPRLVLNGYTSDSGLGASWHVFDNKNACLACLYQPANVMPSQTDMVAEALGLELHRTQELWIRDGIPAPEDLARIARHLGLNPSEMEEWRGKRLREIYTGVICGSVRLDLQGRGRLEALPLAHQSVLAGVFMAAELVKRLTPSLNAHSQQQPLIQWLDVLSWPPTTWVHHRNRVSGCICEDSTYQEVFHKKWRSVLQPPPNGMTSAL
ncbi:MAG: E2 ligase fold family C protein [Hyalangium sp.]|uniref:E2 ligase fold family C protein n=1 Tax=Hyalangium sp. TaxID=2028555 RepID=UPI00389AE446